MMRGATLSREEIRCQLRRWMVGRNGDITLEQLRDDTPILEQKIITSLQTLDLILLIERLRGAPLDVTLLKPGSFRNVDAIMQSFFEGGAHA